MKKYFDIWTLILLIVAHTLAIQLPKHIIINGRFWITLVFMIPVIMGYISGVESERNYQRKYKRKK